jgi:hypothetical protein
VCVCVCVCVCVFRLSLAGLTREEKLRVSLFRAARAGVNNTFLCKITISSGVLENVTMAVQV